MTGKACPPELPEAMRRIADGWGFELRYFNKPLEHLGAVYFQPMGELCVREFDECSGNPIERDFSKYQL